MPTLGNAVICAAHQNFKSSGEAMPDVGRMQVECDHDVYLYTRPSIHKPTLRNAVTHTAWLYIQNPPEFWADGDDLLTMISF